MNLLTNEQIEANELASLGDAIGSCLELNNDFLARYCGAEVREQLGKLTCERLRAYVLQGCLIEGKEWFAHGLECEQPDAIYLPSGEIEIQFEGEPENFFESPEDLTIYGGLAYYYTGYGAFFPVDVAKLAENVTTELTD